MIPNFSFSLLSAKGVIQSCFVCDEPFLFGDGEVFHDFKQKNSEITPSNHALKLFFE